MLEDAIRKWNPWWVETSSLEKIIGIEREITEDIKRTFSLPHIKDIIGIRRSGKTTILYQIIKQFSGEKTDPKDIVFINFDDFQIDAASFEEITDTVEKINPDIKYLFLDEIQQKKGWEQWLRTIYDTKRFRQIFVSGSSASLLSRDIGRTLTGRHITSIVFPFSFREYLRFGGWNNFSPDFLKHNKNKILHHMKAYIEDGGFPEVTGKTEFERETVLTNTYNDILARDIVSRFNASYDITRKICYYLLSNNANEFSLRSVAGSTGLSVETVDRYIGFLEESFIILTLNAFSYKVKAQFKQNKKAYSIDTGLRNAVSFKFSHDIGRLIENIVLIELRRREKEVYYWKDEKAEVDFVVMKNLKPEELIQVCWNITDKNTKEREVNSIIRGMQALKIKEGMIITEDYDGKEKKEDMTIIFTPLWKWLLIE